MLYFLNSIEFKNIKIIADNRFEVGEYKLSILNKKYTEYIFALQKLDNYNGYELNYYFELNKNNFMDIDNNYSKLINLFYENRYDKLPLTLYADTLSRNVLEEHMWDINSKKINNNLTKPYYFFTYRYNEKYMPSQIKQ